MIYLKKVLTHTATLKRFSELSVKAEEIFENLEKIILSLSHNDPDKISNYLNEHRIERADTAFYIALFKKNPLVAENYKSRIDQIYTRYQAFRHQNTLKNIPENDLKIFELLGLYILSLEQLLIQSR